MRLFEFFVEVQEELVLFNKFEGIMKGKIKLFYDYSS